MHSLIHATLEFIRQHQAWSFPIIFIVAFGESLVGFSFIFPGTTVMIIAGTMVAWPFNPHGVLDIWPILAGAISGVVLGDAISFWLGSRFGHLVEKHWYFVRHPDLLKLGYGFFDRFGVASVFIGRFFGPVRAVIPLVAGIMEMPVGKFWFANIASAFVWAPALLLAGSILHEAARAAGAERGMRIAASVVAAILITSAIWAWRRYRVGERIRASLERQ